MKANETRKARLAELPRLMLDVVFPGRCLLCGGQLLFSSKPGAPVCSQCLSRLRPPEGPRCRVCSVPLVSEQGICTRCRDASFSFTRNHSVFAYAAGIKELIRSYKFSHRYRLSRLFAGFLAAAAEREFPGRAIVPAPPRPGGGAVDHVGRIARILGREYGFPVLGLLQRGAGLPQKTLDLEERRRNLMGKIRFASSAIAPQSAVLLDDIFTTGATADACATALKAGGCREVDVLTLALEE